MYCTSNNIIISQSSSYEHYKNIYIQRRFWKKSDKQSMESIKQMMIGKKGKENSTTNYHHLSKRSGGFWGRGLCTLISLVWPPVVGELASHWLNGWS